MEFIYYDLSFLVLFSLIVGLFLYKNRKKLQIENKILLLYRTSFGLNFIEKMSKKSPWVFRMLAILSIASGFILMIIAVLLLLETIRLIWTSVVVIKAPPLMPLIPYLPSLFKIEFLPPFYFTYWIIAIAIVAICHEFMHGVFARFYDVKLKSTGFGFLGPFLAAFVELDEKRLEKKPVKSQMAVLSGGSFANLIISILFLILLNGFFAATFVQAGVTVPQLSVDGIIIPSYSLVAVNATSLTYNGNPINLTSLSLENKTEFKLDGKNGSYYITNEILSITPKNSSILIVYIDSPAYKLKINGTIQKINDGEIKNFSDFKNVMSSLKPYENISIETGEKNYTVELMADPNNSSRAVIGIGFPEEEQKSGAFSSLVKKFVTKKDAFTHYAPISPFSIFIYNLLLWIVLINISVMFVNMLPFGIFDGGRFFYLFLFSLTKSKKNAMKGFKIANMLILFIFIALMAVWLFRTF